MTADLGTLAPTTRHPDIKNSHANTDPRGPDPDAHPDAHPHPDAHSDADPDPHSDAHPDPHSDAHPDPGPGPARALALGRETRPRRPTTSSRAMRVSAYELLARRTTASVS